MFEQTIETSAAPHITITECLGNLVVRGSEVQQGITFHLQGRTEDVTLEREGETFTLAARANCRLTCPPATTLTVRTARANLKIERVKGPITIDTAYSNVTLRDVGPTALEQVFGNLDARRVTGDLRGQTVRGNAQAHQAEGLLSLGLVGGNLVTEGLQGGLEAEQVQGNVRLRSPFSPGATYRLSASGNLKIYIPADASLCLTLRAEGRVRSHVPDLALEEAEEEIRGVLGAGEASLEAQVGGDVRLRPMEPGEEEAEGLPFDFIADLEGLGAAIESRIAEEMAEMQARLEESVGRVGDEVLRRHVEQAIEHAFRQTGQAADRARRAAERAAERARLRAERAERRWRRASGRRPRPPREQATEEEQLRVLRMVEEGKITPRQAAELLAALEGR